MILALCFTRLDTPIYMHVRMICKQNSYLAASHVVAIQGISNDLMFFLDCKNFTIQGVVKVLPNKLSKSYPTRKLCWKHPSPVSNVHFRNTTKIAAQVLALNLCYFALLLSFFLKLSLSLNYELILYF